MRQLWSKSTLAIAACAVAVTTLSALPKASAAQTIYNTSVPSAMRIAIREINPSGEPDPRGRIMYVQALPFTDYCEDVLPNEWFPSWDPESLKAGAMAIKMFGWYHHLHPVTIDGFTFDVDNTTNFQHFRELSGQPTTNAAFASIANQAYAMPNGEIIELNYRAGTRDDPNWQYRNAQKMAQWGSQYWATRGQTYTQILQFYYVNRSLLKIQ